VTHFAFCDARIMAAGTLLHRLNMEFREFDRDYKPVAMVPEAARGQP